MPRTCLVVAMLLLVPGAAAQGTLKVRVAPDYDELTLTAGERKDLRLAVTVEHAGTSCRPGTDIAVSLVLGTFPSWAGASIRPQSARYAQPKETRAATLEMLPDEEAPHGGTATYTIEPFVTAPNSTSCPTSPALDAQNATVAVTVVQPGREPPTPSNGGGLGGAPGFGALLVLGGLGLGLAGRRRRGDRERLP